LDKFIKLDEEDKIVNRSVDVIYESFIAPNLSIQNQFKYISSKSEYRFNEIEEDIDVLQHAILCRKNKMEKRKAIMFASMKFYNTEIYLIEDIFFDVYHKQDASKKRKSKKDIDKYTFKKYRLIYEGLKFEMEYTENPIVEDVIKHGAWNCLIFGVPKKIAKEILKEIFSNFSERTIELIGENEYDDTYLTEMDKERIKQFQNNFKIWNDE